MRTPKLGVLSVGSEGGLFPSAVTKALQTRLAIVSVLWPFKRAPLIVGICSMDLNPSLQHLFRIRNTRSFGILETFVLFREFWSLKWRLRALLTPLGKDAHLPRPVVSLLLKCTWKRTYTWAEAQPRGHQEHANLWRPETRPQLDRTVGCARGNDTETGWTGALGQRGKKRPSPSFLSPLSANKLVTHRRLSF